MSNILKPTIWVNRAHLIRIDQVIHVDLTRHSEAGSTLITFRMLYANGSERKVTLDKNEAKSLAEAFGWDVK